MEEEAPSCNEDGQWRASLELLAEVGEAIQHIASVVAPRQALSRPPSCQVPILEHLDATWPGSGPARRTEALWVQVCDQGPERLGRAESQEEFAAP